MKRMLNFISRLYEVYDVTGQLYYTDFVLCWEYSKSSK